MSAMRALSRTSVHSVRELDLAIGSLDRVGERFTCTPLLEDEFVMVLRSRHPAGRGALSAKVLAALPHLDISSSGEHTDFLDVWLTEQGLARRIALRAPYLSARAILSRSDLAATLSRRIAQEFVRTDRLQIHELPVKLLRQPLARALGKTQRSTAPVLLLYHAELSRKVR